MRDGALWIFGRTSDWRHSPCKGPVAGISLMGCNVRAEAQEPRWNEGWTEGNVAVKHNG